MNIYQQNGFQDRDEYLDHLAVINGVNYDTVRTLADLLGPQEDFDGLVTELTQHERTNGDIKC